MSHSNGNTFETTFKMDDCRLRKSIPMQTGSMHLQNNHFLNLNCNCCAMRNAKMGQQASEELHGFLVKQKLNDLSLHSLHATSTIAMNPASDREEPPQKCISPSSSKLFHNHASNLNLNMTAKDMSHCLLSVGQPCVFSTACSRCNLVMSCGDDELTNTAAICLCVTEEDYSTVI